MTSQGHLATNRPSFSNFPWKLVCNTEGSQKRKTSRRVHERAHLSSVSMSALTSQRLHERPPLSSVCVSACTSAPSSVCVSASTSQRLHERAHLSSVNVSASTSQRVHERAPHSSVSASASTSHECARARPPLSACTSAHLSSVLKMLPLSSDADPRLGWEFMLSFSVCSCLRVFSLQ